MESHWKRIMLNNKSTLPPLGELVVMYTEKEGYIFASITERLDRTGKKQYYYHLNRYDTLAVKGKKIWWQPKPALPMECNGIVKSLP